MKYKLIGIAAAAVMICFAVLLNINIKTDRTFYKRYHQHLMEPEYIPCKDHGEEVFCTHLPIVVIDTLGLEIPGRITGETDMFGENITEKAADGTDFITAYVSVKDNKEGNNHLCDASAFTTKSLLRIRGHSSREFEKAPYLMKFTDDSGSYRDIEVMGMKAHHEWILHGPYLDKSLVRNYMWYNISGSIMEYAPNVRYCEVFLNGDYRGLYLMTETITNGKNCRLKLNENIKGEEFKGYLVRTDRPEEKELGSVRNINTFTERVGIIRNDMALKYPGKKTLTEKFAKEAETEISRFEKALYSYDCNTKKYGFRNWIDVDNFIDYYLINEFTSNGDMGSCSTYMYKSPGEKYKMCVWDFNNSCNNYEQENYGEYGFVVAESGYYSMLLRDKEFVSAVIKRYRELRKSYLSREYLIEYINDTLKWLKPAAERNYIRWKDAYNEDMLNKAEGSLYIDRNRHTPEEAKVFLCGWISERGNWLDRNIDVLKFYSHPSRNKDRKFEKGGIL